MKIFSIIQIVLEVFVVIGYLIGLEPFGYLIALWWVIPFTLGNIVLSIVARNKTVRYTAANFCMAILGLIPIIGIVFRIIGIILSVVSVLTIFKKI